MSPGLPRVLQYAQNRSAAMRTLTVKLPTPLAAWLSRRARELGRTQSDLVREALRRARGRDERRELP